MAGERPPCLASWHRGVCPNFVSPPPAPRCSYVYNAYVRDNPFSWSVVSSDAQFQGIPSAKTIGRTVGVNSFPSLFTGSSTGNRE